MTTRTVLMIAGAASITFLAACGSSGGGSESSGAGSAGGSSGAAVSVQGGTLVAANGHVLYDNTVDSATSIKCTGTCASLWPPVAGPASAGTGVTAGDLGTVTRPDGSKQATYQGHPLYEFTGDKSAGATTGEGVADLGGTWHVVKIGAAGPSTTPSSSAASSGGGGYTY